MARKWYFSFSLQDMSTLATKVGADLCQGGSQICQLLSPFENPDRAGN